MSPSLIECLRSSESTPHSDLLAKAIGGAEEEVRRVPVVELLFQHIAKRHSLCKCRLVLLGFSSSYQPATSKSRAHPLSL